MMQPSAPRILPGNAQDRGDRAYQEDAFGCTGRGDEAFLRHGGIAAVLCDGMGGLEHGAQVAALGVDTFLEEYRRKQRDETPAAALRRSVLRANDAVHRYARDNGLIQRTGCTLVAVVARGVELHCIHVGDSRAYLYSGGVLERLTNDHTLARRLQLQVEQGQITVAEAEEHPRRDHLTSNLGRQDLTELEVLDPPRKLAPSDWILLCSDGLHGVLGDAEITAELYGNSQEAARRLVERVTSRPMLEKDNVTVVLMQVSADGGVAPLHLTSRTGGPRLQEGRSAGRARALASTAPSKPAGRPVSRKPSPLIWAASAVPLVLALLAWKFWPTPVPPLTLVQGVQPPAPKAPALAPEREDPRQTLSIVASPRVGAGTLARPAASSSNRKDSKTPTSQRLPASTARSAPDDASAANSAAPGQAAKALSPAIPTLAPTQSAGPAVGGATSTSVTIKPNEANPGAQGTGSGGSVATDGSGSAAGLLTPGAALPLRDPKPAKPPVGPAGDAGGALN